MRCVVGSITGVDDTPIHGAICEHSDSEAVSGPMPLDVSLKLVCQSGVSESASNAYNESNSVATSSTLCVALPIWMFAATSGWASTLPSTLSCPSMPKLVERTAAGVSAFSYGFQPVRKLSKWNVRCSIVCFVTSGDASGPRCSGPGTVIAAARTRLGSMWASSAGERWPPFAALHGRTCGRWVTPPSAAARGACSARRTALRAARKRAT